MDYLEIVLRGYFDDNNRGHLENYFYREFKKAEKQFFLPDAFFGGCRKIIEQLEQHIRFKLLNRKGDSSINENDFTTHLENVPGGWGTYDIHKIELSIIKEAINKAFHKATNSNAKSGLVFFNKVLDGEIIGQLDILNTVDEMTGFDIVKLKALQRDLEIYLEMDYWETRDAISQVEIKIEMSRLEKNKLLEFVVEDGKKIPKRKIFKKENGKIISSTKTIDIEDMFFPDKYIFIRRVINLIKEKIEDLQTKEKPTKLSDFFDLNKIEPSKVNEIQNAFKEEKGKRAAALIYLLRDDHKLIKIIPHDSQGKGFANFYKVFGFEGTYEAVRKCFDERNNWNYSDTDETLLSVKERLNEILK